MRVAVCDSNKKFVRRIKGILKKYEQQQRIHVEMERFSDALLLPEMIKEQSIDLILLDAFWGEKTMEDDSRLIYVCLFENHERPGSPPSAEFMKPIRKKQIFGLLNEVQKYHQSQNRLFSYIRERVMYQVPYSEILYFQSDGRKIEIHTIHSEQPQEYIGKLSELQEQGLPPNFITIHKSYIVNREYIVRRSYEYVFLEKRSLWLSVSQNHRRQVREVLEQCPIERIRDEEAAEEILRSDFLL